MGLSLHLFRISAYAEKALKSYEKLLEREDELTKEEKEELLKIRDDLFYRLGPDIAYWYRDYALNTFFTSHGKEISKDEFYLVTREDLKNLVLKCTQALVIKDPKYSEELFPGDTFYDQSFFYDELVHTTTKINTVLAEYKVENFLYFVSW